MTPDELKSIPKGYFIVMKTGTPHADRLRLFLEWDYLWEPYQVSQQAARKVYYASKAELLMLYARLAFPASARQNNYRTPKRKTIP